MYQSAHIDVVSFQQSLRSFQSACRIVITSCDDDLNTRNGLRSIVEKLIEHFFRTGRGIGRIEHVAADEQRVGLLLAERFEHPAQEMGEFPLTIVSVKTIAQVPVGSMNKFHFLLFIL